MVVVVGMPWCLQLVNGGCGEEMETRKKRREEEEEERQESAVIIP